VLNAMCIDVINVKKKNVKNAFFISKN